MVMGAAAWSHYHGAAREKAAGVTLPELGARAGGELHVTANTVVTIHGGVATSTSAGGKSRVGEGDKIESRAEGEATLALPRSVRVKIGAATDAWIVKAADTVQRLRLDLGKTEVSVPRPGGPEVFSIRTPDSEVVVHGTEFSVLVERTAPNPGTVTSVAVVRGSVLVIHGGEERLVAAGENWSSRTRAPAPAPSTAAAEVSQGEAPLRPRGAPRSSPALSLTEQNRLFQASLDARDAHDDARAVRYLDELLSRFPNTPLADQAKTARFRALERLGALQNGQH
jgi:hypothetical protein